MYFLCKHPTHYFMFQSTCNSYVATNVWPMLLRNLMLIYCYNQPHMLEYIFNQFLFIVYLNIPAREYNKTDKKMFSFAGVLSRRPLAILLIRTRKCVLGSNVLNMHKHGKTFARY